MGKGGYSRRSGSQHGKCNFAMERLRNLWSYKVQDGIRQYHNIIRSQPEKKQFSPSKPMQASFRDRK